MLHRRERSGQFSGQDINPTASFLWGILNNWCFLFSIHTKTCLPPWTSEGKQCGKNSTPFRLLSKKSFS